MMPDTMGAVGPDHIVEFITGRYSVYRKSDHRRVQSQTLDQFWVDAGAGTINRTLDSRLVYDPFSRRWFATSSHVAFPDNPYTLLLAVSRSSDPMEGWTGFTLVRDPRARGHADFPRLGLDADAVYVKAGIEGDEDCEQVIVVAPKSDLLASTPTVANAAVLGGMECFGGLSPALNLDGSGGPFHLFQSEPSDGKASLVTITGPLHAPVMTRRDVATHALPSAPPAEQPAAQTQKPGIRVFYSITAASVLRHGTIWSVETVGHKDRAAIRWLEVDPKSATVVHEGLITDPQLHLYNASIAVNEFGNVVIACNGSSVSQFVGIYAVAGVTDASGDTTFGRPLLVKAGVDDFGINHWGDYSATVVDPLDPARFWTFQEWVSGDDVYSTEITELVVPLNRRPR
jgi:hypothetical protein